MPAALPAFRRAMLAWHRKHGLRAPWRESGDPYQALVAAVMAQQTQMSRVLPKYEQFMAAFATVESLARATPGRVLRVWEGMGYNMRALRLRRAARRIVKEGGFPRTAAALQEIEGIGPFTAAIVASFAFGEATAAIDTNVERVARRLAGDLERQMTAVAVASLATSIASRRAPGRWNQAMMDLGGTVCTARQPRCEDCPVARWCRGRPLLAQRVAEARAPYRAGVPFRDSNRFYRGRIVQALRELPAASSMTKPALLRRLRNGTNGIDRARLTELIEGLRRDGLVRIERSGRVRLP